MWMKQLRRSLRYFLGICLKELRDTKENLSQGSHCLDLDSNQSLPEYKSKALQMEPTFFRDLLKE
jgi:hypothetical protein